MTDSITHTLDDYTVAASAIKTSAAMVDDVEMIRVSRHVDPDEGDSWFSVSAYRILPDGTEGVPLAPGGAFTYVAAAKKAARNLLHERLVLSPSRREYEVQGVALPTVTQWCNGTAAGAENTLKTAEITMLRKQVEAYDVLPQLSDADFAERRRLRLRLQRLEST
jgi:hypothetical protein